MRRHFLPHYIIGLRLIQVDYSLLPQHTSLKGYNSTVAFNSAAFYTGWDIGVNWLKEGLKYALMLSYAGVIEVLGITGFMIGLRLHRTWRRLHIHRQNIA